MQIGEKIKNYRKTAGLTQEQVADYLDVSTPAVNKWEKGNTYPDISLLPAIARLLKIDMNELFSFREELTEKEIGQFVNELSEVSLDSFIKAFEMGKNKIKEYPHCDSLIYSIATVLNAVLTLSDVDDEKKLECNNVIVEWLERTAESPNEKVRISSIFMLARNIYKWKNIKKQIFFWINSRYCDRCHNYENEGTSTPGRDRYCSVLFRGKTDADSYEYTKLSV